MAATGKTTNFKLPVYQAGDTVSVMGSYNQAMEIIDSTMEENRITGQSNSEGLESQQTQIEKLQGDITALQTSVENAQGSANGALNQIQEIVNPTDFHLPPINSNIAISSFNRNDSLILAPSYISKAVNEALSVTLTVGGTQYYVLGKSDNSNPARLAPNQMINYSYLERTVINSIPTIENVVIVYLYYDGINTYLMTTNNLETLPNSNGSELYVMNNIYLFNSQPTTNSKQPTII